MHRVCHHLPVVCEKGCPWNSPEHYRACKFFGRLCIGPVAAKLVVPGCQWPQNSLEHSRACRAYGWRVTRDSASSIWELPSVCLRPTAGLLPSIPQQKSHRSSPLILYNIPPRLCPWNHAPAPEQDCITLRLQYAKTMRHSQSTKWPLHTMTILQVWESKPFQRIYRISTEATQNETEWYASNYRTRKNPKITELTNIPEK